jgi:AcrR family transcriptional regulator
MRKKSGDAVRTRPAKRPRVHGEDRPRVHAEDRQRQLVRVAAKLLAERGFEGLRTRDIAAAANINIATLHYHFPTKEALVHAVVVDLVDQFRSARVGAPSEGESALQLLRLEMQDVRTRLVSAQEQLAVLTELAIRARRDPAVERILRRMDEGWRGQLRSILERGKRSGEFRPDLDTEVAANAIMTQLRGLGYAVGMKPAAVLRIFDQIEAQIELWLKAN